GESPPELPHRRASLRRQIDVVLGAELRDDDAAVRRDRCEDDAAHRAEYPPRRLGRLTPAPAPRLAVAAVAVAIAVAFADSSIVALALPQLYVRFHTTIVGVSWVITAYNLVVAAAAFALVPWARRLSPRRLAAPGLAVFCAASVGCGASSA